MMLSTVNIDPDPPQKASRTKRTAAGPDQGHPEDEHEHENSAHGFTHRVESSKTAKTLDNWTGRSAADPRPNATFRPIVYGRFQSAAQRTAGPPLRLTTPVG